ncbi:MAG: ankyrin repeat domain-containing protein, partial [bacterium]
MADRTGCRSYPLVKAMQLKCSDDVILALLAADKEAAKQPCLDGALPLHRAIKYKHSKEVIKAILDANIDAVSTCDNYNVFPLQRAIQYEASEDIVLMLLKENLSVTTKMYCGCLPLQQAMALK